ncbi:antiviral reverse transcriptase Drt2 [Pseudomonas rhodesiae]|uniref:antiviral reverse transcriptase Drt2 n=1 Tax=Pseudomonas rhodesiae TaxID=76760 RepID=UPI00058B5D0F|nr:antiviral reverse transcriptase Drt2 [Pseudomonas rhodesiae]
MSNAWYKSRRYLHFDRPVNEDAALKVVSDQRAVARHSFYPLIRYVAESQKVHFDKAAGRVVKKDPKKRQISYAAHLDSHIYSYYCEVLSDLYERYLSTTEWSASVLAFRTLGKSNIEFAYEAFMDIASRTECCVVGIDIKGFFDNLSHTHLKSSWQKLIDRPSLPDDHFAVFKSLTRFSFVDREEVYSALGISKNNPKNGRQRICEPHQFRSAIRGAGLVETNSIGKGIPQGSPISALLSNIYMMDFDEKLYSYVENHGGSYFRYCDDILLIVPLAKEAEAIQFVDDEVAAIKLEVQKTKTEVCRFKKTAKGFRSDRALQYLGFIFDGENIYLRSSSLARYQERVNRGLSIATLSMLKVNTARIARGQLPRSIFLRKLHSRYSYLGRRNFISYGYRAARIMNSKSIRKQLKPLWGRLRKKIEDIA